MGEVLFSRTCCLCSPLVFPRPCTDACHELHYVSYAPPYTESVCRLLFWCRVITFLALLTLRALLPSNIYSLMHLWPMSICMDLRPGNVRCLLSRTPIKLLICSLGTSRSQRSFLCPDPLTFLGSTINGSLSWKNILHNQKTIITSLSPSE